MYRSGYGDPFQHPMALYQQHMLGRAAGRPRRFDEYYRCYPIVMLPGPERESANHGGKIFLPASALDKLTTLHITYPMLFELFNGTKEKRTHSGVLEFIAEEGRCYLPYWLMQTLCLDPGDLVQIKSTDLPAGNFVKLQPQSPAFLDISDPKAVLETTFRNFSCLTLGDIFTFSYNDTIYSVAVLEVKPDAADTHAISVQETDLVVDFAEPVGYSEELERQKAAASAVAGNKLQSNHGHAAGGVVHTQGSMARAINYASIAPASSEAAEGHASAHSAFAGAGQRLVPKKSKGNKIESTEASVPINGATPSIKPARRLNGPQPLRLPHGKLFFGYEVKPLRDKNANASGADEKKHHFQGQGETLRKKKGEVSET